MNLKINDRRDVALGGQRWNRPESQITAIAWHYTGVARRLGRFITSHEAYWRDTHKWTVGGYHYYIDAQGNIWQNYNLTTQTNGVGGQNDYIVHISLEAGSAGDYSEAQIKARHDLTLYLMKRLNIKSNRVMGHKEFPNQTTACPGYSTAQMNAFRRKLVEGRVAEWIKDGKGWWYRRADGSYPKAGWELINKYWYLFDSRGYMLTGWQLVNKDWFFMNPSGRMLTGWVNTGKDWFYFQSNGRMLTGWQLINNTWYHLGAGGHMSTGLQYINRRHYFLDKSGAMRKNTGVQLNANTHGYLS